jgi:hypothetical protein
MQLDILSWFLIQASSITEQKYGRGYDWGYGEIDEAFEDRICGG